MGPTVAVVTAVRNAEDTLEDTLASVARQSWRPLEHIVVDGASTDGTRAILERQGPGVRWVSEPDRGLYDAMNKGLAIVRDPEAYVVFLNADDVFHGEDAIERALAAAGGEDFLYGRLERYDQALDHRDIIGREVTARDMVLGMRCHHQAMLTRARVFRRVGGFDLRYRFAADYDWAVRVFLDPTLSRRFVPVIVATMRRGGVSDRPFSNDIVNDDERADARELQRPREVDGRAGFIGIDEDEIEGADAIGCHDRQRIECFPETQIHEVLEAGSGNVRSRDLRVPGVRFKRHQPSARGQGPRHPDRAIACQGSYLEYFFCVRKLRKQMQ